MSSSSNLPRSIPPIECCHRTHCRWCPAHTDHSAVSHRPWCVKSSMKNGWKTSHEFQPISRFSGKNICIHHVFLSEMSFFQSKTLPNFCFPPKSAKNSTQIWASHPNKNSKMSTFPKKNSKKNSRKSARTSSHPSIPAPEDVEPELIHRRGMVGPWRWLLPRRLHREPALSDQI